MPPTGERQAKDCAQAKPVSVVSELAVAIMNVARQAKGLAYVVCGFAIAIMNVARIIAIDKYINISLSF